MKLERLEIELLARIKDNPGLHKAEICRPLLGKRSQSYFDHHITCLEACGFLRTEHNPGTVRIWATPKATRHLRKLFKKGMEADLNE